MEAKTIGSFLAVLRKANGMTQKELAERLNVSDKTVSRWERDDGAPDLSLIPVIAEIFGVTCDELLRGQRNPPEARTESAGDEVRSEKGEKQRRYLLQSALSQYGTLIGAAIGISAAGLIVALICNLAFNRASLGFLLGCMFFVGSIIVQTVWMNQAIFKVADSDLEEASLHEYKNRVIRLGEKALGVTVFFLGFTFPMLFVDAYYGLTLGSMLLWGSVGGAGFLLVYSVILYFGNATLIKKGTLHPSSKEVYWQNHRLKGRCAGICAGILVISVLFQMAGMEVFWSSYTLSSEYSVTFEDYASFVSYMEEEDAYSYGAAPESGTVSLPLPEGSGQEDERPTATLTDINGNVVCTYTPRRSVSVIRYTPKDGTVLPIEVVTDSAYRQARALSNLITGLYCAVYPVEILIAVLIYRKKRAR